MRENHGEHDFDHHENKSKQQRRAKLVLPKNASYSHFPISTANKTEILDIRKFEEDNPKRFILSVKSKEELYNTSDLAEIKSLDILVLKQRCLGMGKRLSWHMERVQEPKFDIHTILDNSENITYPIRIDFMKGENNRVLQARKPSFFYSEHTQPSFFFNEYKVAIIADIANHV